MVSFDLIARLYKHKPLEWSTRDDSISKNFKHTYIKALYRLNNKP